MNGADQLLELRDLHVHFGSESRPLRAVDGVDLSVARGESVGLVGESGCGKSTLARTIMQLEQPVSGTVLFKGSDVSGLTGARRKAFVKNAQMVFQDPFGSLNPRMAVGAALREVLKVHHYGDTSRCAARAADLFEQVGLDPVYLERYPHEFSGGQRQRIGIARALAVEPDLILADEPVSALDVSVQVQILNLLLDLRKKLGLSYLFIAHDLAVVRYMCERIYVMYLGRIVESGPVEKIYTHPQHPYTRALLSAVPDVQRALNPEKGEGRVVLRGDVPSPTETIPGCPFHPRCPEAQDRCRTECPALKTLSSGHRAACLFARSPSVGR